MKLGKTWAKNATNSIIAGGSDPHDIAHMLGQAHLAYNELVELLRECLQLTYTLDEELAQKLSYKILELIGDE